jgi:Cathepsin propeptide inhibitor domain (I29)
MKIVLFLSLTLFLTLTSTSLQHKLIYKYNPEDIPV